MTCADCTAEISERSRRCIYCAASRRASITRKAGGVMISMALLLVAADAELHLIALIHDAAMLMPMGMAIYLAGVIQWLRAPKRPFTTQ